MFINHEIVIYRLVHIYELSH